MAHQDYKNVITIDACNIRNSGGLRHLIELINNSDKFHMILFTKIILWSSQDTLNQINNYPWLIKKNHKLLNINTFISFIFQLFFFKKELKNEKSNVVLVPGGIFLTKFRPFVTVSQNMLPFELNEAFRYKKTKIRIKFLLIRYFQIFSFNRSSGVIFLSNYARNIISKQTHIINSIVIPHGINSSWFTFPKNQLEKDNFSMDNKFNLLYVSNITAYKHQWNVAQAIIELFNSGLPISLTLVGPSDSESYKKLKYVLDLNKNSNDCVKYIGNINHNDLYNYYLSANAFIFASSCENMPLILMEAMSVGLPIICSNKGPMSEFLLENENFYFNPENINELKYKIQELFCNKDARKRISEKSFELSKKYSWEKTTFDTLSYLNKFSSEK